MISQKAILQCVLTMLVICMGLVSFAAAEDQVRFKGTLEGTYTITPVNPPIFAVHLVATGQGTQLGQFTWDFPHVVDRSTGHGEGDVVITAANGDTLTAHITGQSTPTGVPGIITVVEVAVVTGGTGRFVNAAGSFTIERVLNGNTGETSGSFGGTISTPGSNNP